jgi:hypothetical protein
MPRVITLSHHVISDNVITKIVITVIKMHYLITPFYHFHFEHHYPVYENGPSLFKMNFAPLAHALWMITFSFAEKMCKNKGSAQLQTPLPAILWGIIGLLAKVQRRDKKMWLHRELNQGLWSDECSILSLDYKPREIPHRLKLLYPVSNHYNQYV